MATTATIFPRDGRAAPTGGGDRIVAAPAEHGIERLRAWFAGRAYARHRHDTYTICITDRGLQAFDYRGATRRSVPGQIVVLHPDEAHDGRAGADGGFGFRSVYAAPERIAAAAQALCGRPVALPFVAAPVLASAPLAHGIAMAFASFPDPLEPLAADAVVEALAQGLIAADRSIRGRETRACDGPALARARQFLDAEKRRVVASEELEAVTGHGRFALARQFRQAFGTSPYRYLLMRRLDWARGQIRAGAALADVALDAGFADQAHFTRQFKAAYGLSPARFRAASAASP
ncbi:MAG: AraC family transcriptional regulator [Rhodospirillaceae bacterium]|nr:AraC family transcriptional regulator [Rhodospirillaceae bacterium]